MMQQLWNRLQLVVAQGVSKITSTHKIQITVLDGETLTNIDRIQPYGYSYRPKAGSQAFVIFPSGDRTHGLCLVVGDKKYTIELAEGEACLHDDQGQKVHIKRDRILVETSKTFEVRADKIKLHANSEYHFDVNGQGQKWDGQGVEKWQDDDQPRPNHPHSPPEI